MSNSLKSSLILIVGIIIGALITILFIWNLAPSMMMNENESKFSFDESATFIEQSITDAGWKISAIHDLQKSMQNFGKSVNKVRVYEICNPEHAYKVLSQNDERIVSSLMPCRISIYEKEDGKTYISMMNTGLMGQMMDGVVPEVMKDASRESEAIIKDMIKL